MATKRLYRDTEHAMLGGVCAGIANRLDLDPTLIRVIAIAMAVVTFGTTVLLYLALWVIMPAGEGATGRPSREGLTAEVRDVSERVREAGRIVTQAARETVDELSHLRERRSTDTAPSGGTPGAPSPSAPPPPPPPTSAGAAPTEEQRRQQEQQ